MSSLRLKLAVSPLWLLGDAAVVVSDLTHVFLTAPSARSNAKQQRTLPLPHCILGADPDHGSGAGHAQTGHGAADPPAG